MRVIERQTVTLANRRDIWGFRVGSCVTWPKMMRPRLAARLASLLWWRRPRLMVSAVDAAAGTLTLVAMRWSWWRWKWVVR